MASVPKYLESQLIEEKESAKHKQLVDSYSIHKRIRKLSNFEILELCFKEYDMVQHVGSAIYRSDSSYPFWSQVKHWINNDVNRDTFKQLEDSSKFQMTLLNTKIHLKQYTTF